MRELVRAKTNTATTTPATTSRKLIRATPVAPVEEPKIEGVVPKFFRNVTEGASAVASGDVSIKEGYQATADVVRKAGETFAPASTKFIKTTGGIFGEGLAYATDKNVREQYRAGNLDVLPTITNTTPEKLDKYIVAVGIEAAVARSFPKSFQAKLGPRTLQGGLQGIGFALSDGLANDKTAEEILKSMPEYGVSGSVINIAAPWLLPFLRKQVAEAPTELRGIANRAVDEPVDAPARKLDVTSQTNGPIRVPISTPNKRYEAYLRSQGYEPYVKDVDLPTIEAGAKPKSTSDLPVIQAADDTADVGVRGLPPPPGTKLVPEIPARPSIRAEKPTAITSQPATAVNDIVPAQPTLTKIPVAQDKLPVAGPSKTTALEERLIKESETPQGRRVSELDPASSNKEQIRLSAQVVSNLEPEEIMRVVRGEVAPPEGVLYNAFLNAASKKAEMLGNANLITRIAGQASKRFGQEIQFTRNFDDVNPIDIIQDIVTSRSKRAARRSSIVGAKAGSETEVVKRVVAQDVKKGKQVLSQQAMKVKEAEDLIASLLC